MLSFPALLYPTVPLLGYPCIGPGDLARHPRTVIVLDQRSFGSHAGRPWYCNRFRFMGTPNRGSTVGPGRMRGKRFQNEKWPFQSFKMESLKIQRFKLNGFKIKSFIFQNFDFFSSKTKRLTPSCLTKPRVPLLGGTRLISFIIRCWCRHRGSKWGHCGVFMGKIDRGSTVGPGRRRGKTVSK